MFTARQRVHIIADNLGAHKAKPVQTRLAAHPRVTLHDTPTYSSWLNQGELWFAKIERDCNARGNVSSTANLRRKFLRYVKLHNATCPPFLWRYRDPKRRIRATRISVRTQVDSAEGSGPTRLTRVAMSGIH